MIELSKISQLYGSSQILWDLDMTVKPGSITCLMGRNGVGKTTALKVLMGLLPTKSGKILIDGDDYTNKVAEARPHSGVGYVPQGRDVFPQLTVEENLRTALSCRKDKSKKIPERIYELFPVLYDMLDRRAGDLSGGQQQQLAIGRALVFDPKVLLLDEPNEGIQPNIVQQIGDVILKLNEQEGITVLLVEQKLNFARKVGQEFCLMEKGRIVAKDSMDRLSDDLIKRHLAV